MYQTFFQDRLSKTLKMNIAVVAESLESVIVANNLYQFNSLIRNNTLIILSVKHNTSVQWSPSQGRIKFPNQCHSPALQKFQLGPLSLSACALNFSFLLSTSIRYWFIVSHLLQRFLPYYRELRRKLCFTLWSGFTLCLYRLMVTIKRFFFSVNWNIDLLNEHFRCNEMLKKTMFCFIKLSIFVQ